MRPRRGVRVKRSAGPLPWAESAQRTGPGNNCVSRGGFTRALRSGAHLGSAATRMTFESDYDAVLTVKARRDRLDESITAMAADCEFTPVLRWLGCLRGIGTLTGFAVAVEVGDWDRFTGKTIGSFIGLVPSEYSSGQSRVQGPIPRPATPTCGGCWSKPRGTTGPATSSGRPCGTGGSWPSRRPSTR
jgi:transposase